MSAHSGSDTSAWDGYRDLKDRRRRPAGGNLSEEEMMNEVILIRNVWFWNSWLRDDNKDTVND